VRLGATFLYEGFAKMADIGHIHRTEYALDIERSEPVVIGEAPGRVHYLGEHSEPGYGLYLSSAIDRSICIAVSARKDASFRFYAANLNERKRTTLANFRYKREDRWANYIKVAVQIFIDLGYLFRGLNFSLVGNIPQHIGLASSQAIEVAAVVVLRAFFKAPIDDEELLNRLIISHELFFGKRAPAIDYAISLFAQNAQFLMVDEKTLEITPVTPSFSDYKILIMDARVPRIPVDEELADRHLAIKKGLEALSDKREGVSFRDYMTAGDVLQFASDLSEEIRRRSMHIIDELRRVSDAVLAIKAGDQQTLSKIIVHSHESLRDLYEVSCPEIDWLVKRAQELDGTFGSRMTGHGFGGCTYTLIKDGVINEFKHRLDDYERIFGFHPIVYEVQLGDGAHIVTENDF
jgi:galactokinase